MGGSSNKEEIYLLDYGAHCWKKLNITLPVPMHSFGVVTVNEEIHIFGGYSNYAFQRNCYKLNDNGTWTTLASLNEKRAHISNSSVVYFEEIWVIGGWSGTESLKSVEKYNSSQNQWIQMPEMNEGRNSTAVVVFKNKIIVSGGDFLKSLEIFDPTLQKWILYCETPFGLDRHSMLIYSDSILTIYGGWSNGGTANVILEMDLEDSEKKWKRKEVPLRSYFGLGKLFNGFMVFGGSAAYSTEIFDGNEWRDGPKLPQRMLQFGFIAVTRSLEEKLTRCWT